MSDSFTESILGKQEEESPEQRMHSEITPTQQELEASAAGTDSTPATDSDKWNEVQEGLNPQKINFVIPVFTFKTDFLGGKMTTKEIISAGLGLASILPQLVMDAEQLFGSITGLGAAKKAAVTGDAIKIIAGQVAADSTGGQADFWTHAMDEISKGIDATVTTLKNLGVFGKSDTPVDPITAITQAAQSLAPVIASIDPATAKTAGVVAATAEQVQAIAPDILAAARNFLNLVSPGAAGA